MDAYKALAIGEPAPWFRQRSTSNPSFAFDTAGGRYLVLGFFGTASDAEGAAALELFFEQRRLFDDHHLAFFGISTDPEDESSGRVGEVLPGMRHFWDFDGSVSRLYGALPAAPAGTGPGEFRRMWVVLDPALRVLAVIPFQQDGGERAELIPLLRSLPPVSHYGGIEMHAPILMLPNVLEPELCRRLVAEYERGGGELSGFMRQVDGKTLRLHDGRHKRRRDLTLEDAELQRVLQQRVISKVVPIIRRVHAFEATRMERYIVGCYDAEDAAHFAPHRDNTTSATAHRRFALSVNLNDDFDGGELCFPEYGPRRYKMPAGGAIVFSGSLLHAVTQVRKGRRYAFLPFLYDEAAAALRERNNAFLGEGIGAYQRMPADPRSAVEAPQSVF